LGYQTVPVLAAQPEAGGVRLGLPASAFGGFPVTTLVTTASGEIGGAGIKPLILSVPG